MKTCFYKRKAWLQIGVLFCYTQGNRKYGKQITKLGRSIGCVGIGGMEDESLRSQKDNTKNKNSGGKGGFTKTKANAMVSVQKFKSKCYNYVKQIKNQCNRKSTSK